MKRIYCYIYIIVFVIPCILHAPINELFQFQQSLNKLTQFLGKPQIPTPPPVKIPITEMQLNTYEDLKKVVNEADYAENTNALDKYKQTIMVSTAKYLLQEYFKEKTLSGKNADYIPFIAYMVQQVVDRYPDKNDVLRCISLDPNLGLEENILENEFLLIRALVYNGYKKILVVPMNLWYSDHYKETTLPRKFKTWVDINVPTALKDTIVLDFLPPSTNEYIYISDVKKEEAFPNNLFYMIQSSSRSMQKEDSSALLNALPFVFKDYPNTNFLSFEKAQATNKIKIYMPYSPSDIFITSSIPNTKDATDKLEIFIKNAGIKDPLYQQLLIQNLIRYFYDSILGTEIARGRIGVDIDLFFLDLIKNTAIDPIKPLAFRSLGADPDMTQITDMSGTLQQVYDRYKRPI